MSTWINTELIQGRDLLHYFLADTRRRSPGMPYAIGPLHCDRKSELSRWTHVGFASVMGPPPCGLLFMETFYQIFSPSTTRMICFVLVDYVPLFNLSQNIRVCVCLCARVWARVWERDERVLHLHRRNIDVPYSERKQLLERSQLNCIYFAICWLNLLCLSK